MRKQSREMYVQLFDCKSFLILNSFHELLPLVFCYAIKKCYWNNTKINRGICHSYTTSNTWSIAYLNGRDLIVHTTITIQCIADCIETSKAN